MKEKENQEIRDDSENGIKINEIKVEKSQQSEEINLKSREHRISQLSLPPFCARYNGSLQSNPFALVLHSIVPYSITSSLMTLVKTSLNPQYITHANLTHDRNGSETVVALPTKNNHKLAVFRAPEYIQQSMERIILPIVEEYMSSSSLPLRLRADGFYTKPTGLNPRLRILRYDTDDDFQPHYDKTTAFPELDQTSYLTVLLYLNTLPEEVHEQLGGRTLFHSSRVVTVGEKISSSGAATEQQKHPHAVNCVEGTICLFEHDLYHSGEIIRKEGFTKWILRTDVLFQKKHDSTDQESNIEDESNNDSTTITTLEQFLFSNYLKVEDKNEINGKILEAFSDLGIAPKDTSLEAFVAPGKQMVQCMVMEVESAVSNTISLDGLFDNIHTHLKNTRLQ